MSQSVRVRVGRAEGGSGERQDHRADAPHGQQGSAERHHPEQQGVVKHQNIGTQLRDLRLQREDSHKLSDWHAEHIFF